MKLDSWKMLDAFKRRDYISAAIILANYFSIDTSTVVYRDIKLFKSPGIRNEILFRVSDKRYYWNDDNGFAWEWTGIHDKAIWVWET